MTVKSANRVYIIIGAVFFVIGMIFVIVGICTAVSFNSFKDSAVQTEAVITKIDTDRRRSPGGKVRTNHEVWVRYTAGGEEYEERLGYYSSGMHVGETVDIYVDPGTPRNIKGGSVFTCLIFSLVGLPFAIVGAVFIFVHLAKNAKKKRLLQDGDQLTGTITNVYLVRNVRINGRHPYKAECQVTDPYSGETYLFSSEQVMNDISGLVGSSVTVYADKNNRKEYYVDIAGTAENYGDENKIHDYR